MFRVSHETIRCIMCMFYFILNDRKWSWGGGFHTTGKYDIFLYRNVRHNIYVVCQCCHASVTGCNNNRYILMNHRLQKAIGLLSNRLSPKARPIAKILIILCHYVILKMVPYRWRSTRLWYTVFWRYLQSRTWWRHQMETFSALLAICEGNSPVPGEFPAERPVTRSFDVFFDLCPNKRLSKQWWGSWFETPSSPLRRHCNDKSFIYITYKSYAHDCHFAVE